MNEFIWETTAGLKQTLPFIKLINFAPAVVCVVASYLKSRLWHCKCSAVYVLKLL